MTTKNSQVEINSRVENLFKKLQKDPKSVFYSVGNLSNSVLKKASKSFYEKDKVFVNLYNQLEEKKFYQKGNILPVVTPFILAVKVMLTIQHCIALVSLLSYCMLILWILDFLQNLLLIQNIVFCWLIYLLRKYIFIQ